MNETAIVKERAVVIGNDARLQLAGIVATPPHAGRTADRPCCLFLNAGLVHRVGPNRLYVRLARALAREGCQTLRFDLSGRGDSDVRRDSLSFLESSVLEAGAAMDFMQATRGCNRFVLMGICSGAVNAFQMAVTDPRVVGAVLIDGPAYPTRGYYLRYYLRRLTNLDSWRNTLTARNALGRRLWGRLSPRHANAEGDFGNPFEADVSLPPKEEVRTVLDRLADRGSRLLFIFSSSAKTYNYRNQLRDAFPAEVQRGRMHVEYFPDADHTFTRLYNQGRLEKVIKNWVVATWPATEAQASAVPVDASR